MESWEAALNNDEGPSALILSRQKLNYISAMPNKENKSMLGAYEINLTSHDNKVTLVASGSEVDIAIETQNLLKQMGIESKVVSMPCQELFDKQNEDYKNKILEPGNLIVTIEAGSVQSWQKYIGKDGISVGIDKFGKSAPYKEIFHDLNLTSNKITSLIQEKLRK